MNLNKNMVNYLIWKNMVKYFIWRSAKLCWLNFLAACKFISLFSAAYLTSSYVNLFSSYSNHFRQHCHQWMFLCRLWVWLKCSPKCLQRRWLAAQQWFRRQWFHNFSLRHLCQRWFLSVTQKVFLPNAHASSFRVLLPHNYSMSSVQ